MFYSRLPVPKGIDHSSEALNKSTRYFPLIGIIIGSIVALVYFLSIYVFPDTIAITLALASGVIATGAFHEDGFADVCDGFGGGYTIEQKLNIMKDSRVGTYGLLGVIFLFLLKLFFLLELANYLIPLFISIHALSRLSPVFLIYSLKYVRMDELSKVKPIGKKIRVFELIMAIIFSITPLILLDWQGFFLIIPLLFITLISAWFFKRHLGGYTGDCLGAAQQIAELVLLASFYILCNYI